MDPVKVDHCKMTDVLLAPPEPKPPASTKALDVGQDSNADLVRCRPKSERPAEGPMARARHGGNQIS